jgi:hypothetical protein
VFLICGYIAWSCYYGLAAFWRFAVGTATLWMTVGCFFGWILFALAFPYGIFGGGVYQFGRRWWLLAHGHRPPFLAAKPILRW